LCEQHTVAVAVHLHLYFHSVHNSPNAVSVHLCEEHTVAVAVHLHLYFYSVHNLSLYTVCNSSTWWCAGRI